MTMKRTHFPPGQQPTVLTADLCHHTIGIPGESYRACAECTGMTTVAELVGHMNGHADDEIILCTCACHQKRNHEA